MKIAIMQPYFLPYIGYFQLISSADLFIVYDNIKYTKKGWINGKDVIFSLPLKKDSDFLDVREREIAVDFNRVRLLNQIAGPYRRAPYFSQTFPLVEQIVRNEERNLFRFIHHSIVSICKHLGIATDIRISSGIAIDHELRRQDQVIALCEAVGADTYINAIGGVDLYVKDEFKARGIDLKFIKSKLFEYPQFGNKFVPCLSIIDVLMFNPLTTTATIINGGYELL
jgi:hypothetical protein